MAKTAKIASPQLRNPAQPNMAVSTLGYYAIPSSLLLELQLQGEQMQRNFRLANDAAKTRRCKLDLLH